METVNNLSVFQLLQCFRRFISRRGWPETIFSDNGTQFTATAKTLIDAWNKNYPRRLCTILRKKGDQMEIHHRNGSLERRIL